MWHWQRLKRFKAGSVSSACTHQTKSYMSNQCSLDCVPCSIVYFQIHNNFLSFHWAKIHFKNNEFKNMLFPCPFDTKPAIWFSLFVSLLVSSILFSLSVLLLYYIFYWGLRWTGCCIMGPLHFLTIPFTPYCLSYCWKIQVIHHAWRSTWSQFPWYHNHYVTGIQLVVAFRLEEAKVITLLGLLASQVLMSSIFVMLCFLAPFQQPPECGKGLGVNKGSGISPEAADECLRWCQVRTWNLPLIVLLDFSLFLDSLSLKEISAL